MSWEQNGSERESKRYTGKNILGKKRKRKREPKEEKERRKEREIPLERTLVYEKLDYPKLLKLTGTRGYYFLSLSHSFQKTLNLSKPGSSETLSLFSASHFLSYSFSWIHFVDETSRFTKSCSIHFRIHHSGSKNKFMLFWIDYTAEWNMYTMTKVKVGGR